MSIARHLLVSAPTNTDPYIANVVLLLHMDSVRDSNDLFIDEMGNTITRIGAPSTSATLPAGSKFGNACGQFSGTNEALGLTGMNSVMTIGTGAWTFETWVYIMVEGRNSYLYGDCASNGSGANLFWVIDPSRRLVSQLMNTTSVDIHFTTGTVPMGQWTHVSLCINGGNVYLSINGVVERFTNTITDPAKTFTPSSPTIAGPGASTNPALYFAGWLDEFRITKGKARYTDQVNGFAPPLGPFPGAFFTAPDPYYNHNALLAHMDGSNGANVFTDQTSNCILTAGPGVTTSNTVPLFGGTSGRFSDVNGGLTIAQPSPLLANLGGPSSAWTFETWVYIRTGSKINCLYGDCDAATNNGYMTWAVNSSNQLDLFLYTSQNSGSDFVLTSLTVPTLSWVHVSVCKEANNLYMSINGNVFLVTDTVAANNFQPTAPTIGAQGGSRGWSRELAGFLREFRVTRDVARYTNTVTGFPVPTGPFANSMAG